MPEQPQRKPFSGLNFIRNLLPNGGNPDIQPDADGTQLPQPPAPAQPPQGAIPPAPPPEHEVARPATPPHPEAVEPAAAPQMGSTTFPEWGWRPIQRAPGFHVMSENVRQLLAGYTQSRMEDMSIVMAQYDQNFNVLLQSASDRLVEMALPQALSSVSTGAYMGTYGRNDIDVRMFTDAEQTETLLFTSRPLPMVYRWAGGPRAELNTPLAAVRAEAAAVPDVPVPDIFNRPVPERPVYFYEPLDGRHYRVHNDPLREPDLVDNTAARGNRTAAWLPASLMPGYLVEGLRADVRAIVSRFTAQPLEDMTVLASSLHGHGVLDAFLSADVYNEGVSLSDAQAAASVNHDPVVVFLHTNEAADGGYIFLSTGLLIKVGGPLLPEIAELPRYTIGQGVEANHFNQEEDPDVDEGPDADLGNDFDGPGAF